MGNYTKPRDDDDDDDDDDNDDFHQFDLTGYMVARPGP